MLISPAPNFITRSDSIRDVRAFTAHPSQITAHLVPENRVADFRKTLIRGPVPAAYVKILIGDDGQVRAFEGETADLHRRMSEHAPFEHMEPFDAIIAFTAPSIDKAEARGLQWLICEQLATTGCRVEGKAAAERPTDIFWPRAEHAFAHIRALTRKLGFPFFETPSKVLPGLHLHREIEDRRNAEEVWEYSGPYVSTAARINGRLLLLRHSQIRCSAVPITRPAQSKRRAEMQRRKLLAPGPRGTMVTLCDVAFPSLDAMAKFVRGDFSGAAKQWTPRALSQPTR